MENNQQQPNAGSGLGIAALVLGILALPLASMKCTFMGGLVLGILGVTLSAVGYTQAKKFSSPTSLIMAALIISIISTSLSAIQLSNTFTEIRKFPWSKLDGKLDKVKQLENESDEYEKAFQDEFKKELGGNLEDVLKDLENELDGFDKGVDKFNDELEEQLDSISNEEAARKLGRAAGKALRGFVDELTDSTDTK